MAIRKITLGEIQPIIPGKSTKNPSLTVGRPFGDMTITEIIQPDPNDPRLIEVYAFSRELPLAQLWKTLVNQPMVIEYDIKEN